MLTMPTNASSVVALVGIDPGSNMLGLATLYVDLDTLAIVASEATTLRGEKAARGSWTSEIHGDRLGRIESHYLALLNHFLWVQPLDIASESPFFNRLQPSAYGPLMEVISTIRRAVMHYDMWKQLALIDPPSVKKAVGVKGNKGGKEGKALMRDAVLVLREQLKYNGEYPIEALDEHAIDALAVAYCRYIQLLEQLCLQRPA